MISFKNFIQAFLFASRAPDCLFPYFSLEKKAQKKAIIIQRSLLNEELEFQPISQLISPLNPRNLDSPVLSQMVPLLNIPIFIIIFHLTKRPFFTCILYPIEGSFFMRYSPVISIAIP